MTHAAFASDRALAQQVQEDDSGARRELVQRLLPRAQRLCLALLRDAADAKDASQVAVLQVLRSVHTYRGECSIEHWSDRIVSRTALRWKASQRRASPAVAHEAEVPTFAAPSSKIFARECLQRLPEAQRTALVLRCCFDYSVDEIAEATKTSRNTVKDRLLRARRTLRELMRVEGQRAGDTSTFSTGYALPTAH
jgi:RNA polymerase sigma-70 factor (ECF subfamily)